MCAAAMHLTGSFEITGPQHNASCLAHYNLLFHAGELHRRRALSCSVLLLCRRYANPFERTLLALYELVATRRALICK